MKFASVTVNGKKYNTSVSINFDACFEFETISEPGWILVTHIGSENLYFTFKDDQGKDHSGFCKCL